MKISQAQIEAAARGWYDFDVRNSRTNATWETARLFYLQAAKFALTAAAEVAHNEWPSDELVNNLVASATEEDRRTVAGPAAAEVGESTLKTLIDRADMSATIERCAQLAEQPKDIYGIGAEIAAAIRALKDQP